MTGLLILPLLFNPPPDALIRSPQEYTLRFEETIDREIRVGDLKPQKESDVRVVELLTALGQRFHARATSGREPFSVKGKLARGTGGKVKIEIDFYHGQKTNLVVSDDGATREFDDRTSGKAQLEMRPGDTVVLGGCETVSNLATGDGSRRVKQSISFRLTLLEGEPEN